MKESMPLFTCLVVEDNPDHAELICLALKQERDDCTIDLVEDGSDAIDYLYQRGKYNDLNELPDFVILDLHLKDISGFEVLKTIRSDDRLRHLTVFVVTTSGSVLDRMRAAVYEPAEYLKKPADFDEFVCMIKNLQMYWIKNREPESHLRLTSNS